MITGEYLFHRRYIYLFHVACFFILPIIYGYNFCGERAWVKNILFDVRKNFIRCWIPYTWFFVFFILLGLLQHRDMSVFSLIHAYFLGSVTPMSNVLGVHFLWFLPSMFALLFWKSVWYNSNFTTQSIIIMMGVFLFVQDAFRPFNALNIWDRVPFSLMQGIKYLVIALIVRFFLEHFTIRQGLIVSLSLVLLLTVWFILDEKVPDIEKYTQVTARMWLMPIAVFPLLYYSRKFFMKSKLLIFLGRYSLYIYLFHVFVYNIVNPLALCCFQRSYVMGCITFLITLSISVLLSYSISRIAWLKKIFFPQIKTI
ncbi:MAG: hypothetical protein MJY52_01460 [Bacteroidaceae bacterium]|nr:hypothetical protein [Bacteroidaceae bacterium]